MRPAPDRHAEPAATPVPRGAVRAVNADLDFAPRPSPAAALQQRLLRHAAETSDADAATSLSLRARVGVIVAASAMLWGLIALPIVLARLLG